MIVKSLQLLAFFIKKWNEKLVTTGIFSKKYLDEIGKFGMI